MKHPPFNGAPAPEDYNDRTPEDERAHRLARKIRDAWRRAAADLARRLSVQHSTVMRWARGEHCPSLRMCAAIQTATGGAVTMADFIPPPASEAA
jgi:transcriptional regulator with XRE-family HTH domain